MHGGHDWCQAHQHIGSAPHLTPVSHTFTSLVLGPPSKRKPLIVWTHDMAQLWMASMQFLSYLRLASCILLRGLGMGLQLNSGVSETF